MHRLTPYVAVLVVVVFGLIVSTRGVIAQDDAAADPHPFVGTWLLDSDIDDPTNPMEVDAVTADGSFISIAGDGEVTIGAWEATGDQTANLTVWSPGSGEDEGVGMFIVRASVEIAEDGQSLTAQYTFEVIGEDGATMGDGEYGPGNASGTRLTPEEMGTPAGTFEDLFSMFGGEEEATPEP